MSKTLAQISPEEVAKHNTPEDLWLVIDNRVYDVTKFQKLHPGGAQLLQKYGGKDCTEAFYSLHRQEHLDKYASKFLKGVVGEDKAPSPDDLLISMVPYGEWTHLRKAWKSPYMNESHTKFHMALRKFVRERISPEAEENEEDGEYPSPEIYQDMGQFGLLASRIGVLCMPAVPHMGITLPGGVAPDKFDYFHEMIAHGEMGFLAPGFNDGLGAGFCIGCPPLLLFGQNKVRMEWGRDVLLGKKRVCLAITEPQVGSDVAGMHSTAVKSECGKYWILNGLKKWITNGMFADYFVSGFKTGTKKGELTMFAVERSEGLTTKQISTAYSKSAGTALVYYENVKVPVENVMGEVGKGFMCIMANFNHERWFITCQLMGSLREITRETLTYVQLRKVFGQPLSAQPVVRNKLANMIAAVEGLEQNILQLTHQMNNMDYKTQTRELAGPIALLKYYGTRVATLVSDESVQIFGGRGITKTGMGKKIERLQRTFKFASILGGSEEVLADLAMRQAMKGFPKMARL